MLWSGLVSRVGASHRVSLIAPFPKKNCYKLWTINTIIMKIYVNSKFSSLPVVHVEWSYHWWPTFWRPEQKSPSILGHLTSAIWLTCRFFQFQSGTKMPVPRRKQTCSKPVHQVWFDSNPGFGYLFLPGTLWVFKRLVRSTLKVFSVCSWVNDFSLANGS